MSYKELACLRCRIPIGLDSTAGSAICKKCGNEYPFEEGVLCTDRNEIFMGEFDAPRMRKFIDAAREQGWRRTAEEMAESDSATCNILLSPTRASFVGLLQPQTTGSVLDVGAGMGAVSLQLAKSFDRVYALDMVFERLAFLNVVAEQESAEEILAICHRDVFNLPFGTGTLDAAVMIGAFEYFPLSYPNSEIKDVQLRALSELHRVISPGGTLFIATKNRFGWPFWLGAKDSSGLRFGSLLPRRMADMASRFLLRRSYRVITDSLRGYASLLQDVGFRDLRFYWPVGGYQISKTWVDLTDDKAVMTEIERYVNGPIKTKLLRMLASAHLFKYLVPHFGITIKKTA